MKLKQRRIGKTLLLNSIFYLIVVSLWSILMVLSGIETDPLVKLNALNENWTLHFLVFINASLISFPLSVVLLILSKYFIKDDSYKGIKSIIKVFIPLYIISVTIAYSSQFTLLPHIIRNVENQEIVKLFYFDFRHSIVFFMNQLGYAFFGIAGILTAVIIRWDSLLFKSMNLVLIVCSVLSILAFALYSLPCELPAKLSVISGFLTMPFIIIVLVLSIKLKNGEIEIKE